MQMVTEKCPRLAFLALTVLLGSGLVAFQELADALKNFGKKMKENTTKPLCH
jgi:hypothetical protein